MWAADIGGHLSIYRMTFIALAFSAGCAASLSGDWEGEIECPDQDDTWDIEIDLNPGEKGDIFEGDGAISGLVCELGSGEYVECDFEFDVEIQKEKAFGEQELDVELNDCQYVAAGANPLEVDCDDPDDVEWDGKEHMEGKIENFMGSGLECDLELER